MCAAKSVNNRSFCSSFPPLFLRVGPAPKGGRGPSCFQDLRRCQRQTSFRFWTLMTCISCALRGERRKISRRRRHFLQALLKWDTACFPLIYWLVVLLSKGTCFQKAKTNWEQSLSLFFKTLLPPGLKIHVLTLRGLTCAALKPWLASYKSTEGNILQLNIIYSGHFPERADVLQKSSRVELFFVTVHGILRFFLMMDVDAESSSWQLSKRIW